MESPSSSEQLILAFVELHTACLRMRELESALELASRMMASTRDGQLQARDQLLLAARGCGISRALEEAMRGRMPT